MRQTPPIESITGKDFQKLSKATRQKYIERALAYWRKMGFPYSRLTNEEVFQEYKKLERSNITRLIHRSRIRYSNVGLQLANCFHPQMWQVKSYGHTQAPLDHFNNDETLRKLLVRATNLYPHERCWAGLAIRAMVRIHCSGRVANFRPTASKAIVERFSGDNSRILDFCAGFGGRMLGATSLKRIYFGIDASPAQVSGLRKMHGVISKYSLGSAEIYKGSAEDIMPGMKPAGFDLIFTSPPYFNLEKYSGDVRQSYKRYPSYNAWKENFLTFVIEHSHRLLKRGGYLIVNIADTRRQSLAADFEEITSPFFHLRKKYLLNLSSRPVHRKNGIEFKAEPIYVYQK
jgi:hypothetical protein